MKTASDWSVGATSAWFDSKLVKRPFGKQLIEQMARTAIW